MEARLNYTGSFSNLPKYAIFTASTWMKDITIPENGWSGENVDVVINDSGIDALHFEFQDANGNSRVQLVDWNYLLANGDRLIASGSDGYNEWRSKDFTFAQINNENEIKVRFILLFICSINSCSNCSSERIF